MARSARPPQRETAVPAAENAPTPRAKKNARKKLSQAGNPAPLLSASAPAAADGSAAAATFAGAAQAGGLLADAAAVAQAGDLLADAADVLRDRRRKDFEAGAIDADEAFRSVSEETTLREQATKLFVQANSFILSSSESAQADLVVAIEDARKTIERIAQFRQALKIVAGLIALGGAIVSGQPRAIIGAIQGLRDSTQG